MKPVLNYMLLLLGAGENRTKLYDDVDGWAMNHVLNHILLLVGAGEARVGDPLGQLLRRPRRGRGGHGPHRLY